MCMFCMRVLSVCSFCMFYLPFCFRVLSAHVLSECNSYRKRLDVHSSCSFCMFFLHVMSPFSFWMFYMHVLSESEYFVGGVGKKHYHCLTVFWSCLSRHRIIRRRAKSSVCVPCPNSRGMWAQQPIPLSL